MSKTNGIWDDEKREQNIACAGVVRSDDLTKKKEMLRCVNLEKMILILTNIS